MGQKYVVTTVHFYVEKLIRKLVDTYHWQSAQNQFFVKEHTIKTLLLDETI